MPAPANSAAGAQPQSRVALRHVFRAWDQGDVPCCASMAITVCVEVFEQRLRPSRRLSPLFLCYMARAQAGPPVDIPIERGLEIAARAGLCRLDLHDPAMTPDGAQQPPSAAALADGATRRVVDWNGLQPGYKRLPDYDRTTAWREALSKYVPIVCGFWMTEAYRLLKNEPGRPGLTMHPAFTEGQWIAGHAVPILGYDDELRAFLVKDSRGVRFGDGGYWWLPYAFVESALVEEAWALEQVVLPGGK